MSQWVPNPRIYEINTWVWLNTLSQLYDKPITLKNVPSEELDKIASFHVDAVWLMGVWQRGDITRSSALNYMHEYEGALPNVTEDDVVGSAYAIADYSVEPALGGRKGMELIRKQLAKRGVKLILDFVPNHTGHDHPWIRKHPEYYVQGPAKLKNDGFFEKETDAGSMIIANGKDPYFPGWVDTAQLNAFSDAYRDATVRTLQSIAELADGVRCDMAMLTMNSVFHQTWGWLGLNPPEEDFWTYVVPRVKDKSPNFLFVAEVYWNMNWELLQQGFDYTYDKVMYDRLRSGDVNGITQHLGAHMDYLKRQIRFIENHDEPRAADALGLERSRPAAVLISTVPGATLLHDGQYTGRVIKLPVQISRQPKERAHLGLERFYHRLLEEASDDIYRTGEWRMFRCYASCDGCQGDYNLIAYGWRNGDDLRLIILNLSEEWSQALVDISAWRDVLHTDDWVLLDVLRRSYIEEQGESLANEGLIVDMEPYESVIYHFRPRPRRTRRRKQLAERAD